MFFFKGVLEIRDGYIKLVDILNLNSKIVGKLDSLESLCRDISRHDNKTAQLIQMKKQKINTIVSSDTAFLKNFEDQIVATDIHQIYKINRIEMVAAVLVQEAQAVQEAEAVQEA